MNSLLHRSRRHLAVGAVVALLASLAACADDEDPVTASPVVPAPGTPAPLVSTPAAAAPVTGELIVFAAASLTGTFTELGKTFEAANPGAKVTFQFGSSATLAAQINEGAPADVFAAASPATMATVTAAGGASSPAIFVRNSLQIAVPAGNPAGVDALADFADEALDIALCAAEVPCGAAADKVFSAATITPAPDTREPDVKAVLAKVVAGEVDAALVYTTDVLAAGDAVEGIEFPEAAQAINDYPIAPLTEAGNAAAAAAWVAFILSPAAQQVLTAAGFGGA
ncbi:MAG: molybdate ABC transporter substrate-binding protein [Sporichthyaceae bacterium]